MFAEQCESWLGIKRKNSNEFRVYIWIYNRKVQATCTNLSEVGPALAQDEVSPEDAGDAADQEASGEASPASAGLESVSGELTACQVT